MCVVQSFSTEEMTKWWSAVDCVRVITLEGSDQFPLFLAEAERVGLTNYAIQVEKRDPDGGDAGCFRAHVRASQWGLKHHCQALLVLEDDVYFERPDPTIDLSGVLSSNEYDMLYLGSMQGDRQRKSDWEGIALTKFQMWTHAYVVPPATQRWIASLGYNPNDGMLGTIDWVMNIGHQPLHLPTPIPNKYTIVPQMVFQRFHSSSTASHTSKSRIGQLLETGVASDSSTQKLTETMSQNSNTCLWLGSRACSVYSFVRWLPVASTFQRNIVRLRPICQIVNKLCESVNDPSRSGEVYKQIVHSI